MRIAVTVVVDVVVDVVVLVIIPVETEPVKTEMLVNAELVVDAERVDVELVDKELVVNVEMVNAELIDVELVTEFEVVVTVEDVVLCAVEELESDEVYVVLELELDLRWLELDVEESMGEPVDEEDKTLLEVVELAGTIEPVDWLDKELAENFTVVEIVKRLVPCVVEEIDELVIDVAILVEMVEVEVDPETEDAVVTAEADDFGELVEVFRILEVVRLEEDEYDVFVVKSIELDFDVLEVEDRCEALVVCEYVSRLVRAAVGIAYGSSHTLRSGLTDKRAGRGRSLDRGLNYRQ